MAVADTRAVWGGGDRRGVVVTSRIQLAPWEGLRKGDLESDFGFSGRWSGGSRLEWSGPE